MLKLSKKIEYIKIINVESIDDKDEYFEKKRIITQVIAKIRVRLVEIAKRTPRYTAIPLPPLNFSQTGKT